MIDNTDALVTEEPIVYQKILVAGAGKSSIYLIHYLLSHARRFKWHVIVADANLAAINEKLGGHDLGFAVELDIMNVEQRQQLVQDAALVVSLMPPHLHIHLAKDCLAFKKNLITSSYISDEMRAMDAEVKAAGLMFMCEMGLDPGIDHMTASQILHSIQKLTGSITMFKSYCGGLIAPESDDNPWHYKFSWNPKNIITAGADGATFLKNEKEISVPYEKMFEHSKRIHVNGLGELAFYPNRDSLRYLDIYDVPDIHTFLRATLRHPDFCKGWQAIIELGLTDMNDNVHTSRLSYAQWIAGKTNFQTGGPEALKVFIARKLDLPPGGMVMRMLAWLGLFEETAIIPAKANSGEILLDLLLQKWEMQPSDKDMVVMQHEVEYAVRNQLLTLTSTMVIKGENREFSAMAKTVGLPMGILARLVMRNKIALPLGVHIPNMPNVYRPVLKELQHYGIIFQEEVR